MALAEVGIQVRALDAAKAKADIAAVRGETDKLTQSDQRLAAAGQEASRAMTGTVVPIRRGTAEMKNFGIVAGQLSYQVQDFAVQVASGTSAFMAFAQQAPQAAGAFSMLGGRLGAIIPYVGTIIAIGAAVAPVFLNMGEKAKSAGDRIEDLAGAMDRYRSAVDAASITTDELRRKYGDLAEAARAALIVTMQQAAHEANERLAEVLTAQQDLVRATSQIDFVGPDQTRRRLQALNTIEEYNLTIDAARRLKDAFFELETAEGPRQQSVAAAELRNLLVEIYGTVERMPPQISEFYFSLNEASLSAAELAQLTKTSAEHGQTLADLDMASGISAAGAEALFLAQQMGISLEKAQAIAGVKKAQEGPQLGFGRGSAPVLGAGNQRLGFGDNPGQGSTYRHVTPEVAPYDPPKQRGGGGGKSEAQREAEQLHKSMESAAEAFYKATRTPMEEYAATVEELKQLRDGGFLDGDTFTRAMKDARETLDKVGRDTLGVGDSFSKMLGGMLTDADSASEHLTGFVASVLNNVLTKMTQPSVDILGNAAASFLSGFMPGAGASAAPATSIRPQARASFDGGGWTGNGPRSGGVDGKGGFFAIMHPREYVHDTTKGPMPGGGRESVHVTVGVDPRNGSIQPYVTRTAGQMDAQSARAQQKAMPRVQADNQRRRIAG